MMTLINFFDIRHTAWEVTQALGPLVVFFFYFQCKYLKYPRVFFLNMVKGIVLCFVGLTLFLQGVQVGFMPVGTAMGIKLGTEYSSWTLVPIGFVLGLVATIAEPAVHILSYEVEKASSGAIRRKIILLVLSMGVAIFVALGMAKIIHGIPIYYIVIPGYILAIILMRFCDAAFIGIAFDAGGVATGPMTVTFVLAVALGIAEALDGRSPVLDGFGLIALVALAPIVSMMLLGVLINYLKQRNTRCN